MISRTFTTTQRSFDVDVKRDLVNARSCAGPCQNRKLLDQWTIKTENIAKWINQLSDGSCSVYREWSSMQTRTFRLSPSNCSRKIFDTQVDDRTTANRVPPRIRGMKPKFDVADIEPNEPIYERHVVTRTFQQIRPPRGDH